MKMDYCLFMKRLTNYRLIIDTKSLNNTDSGDIFFMFKNKQQI